jgi:hypothetical protein
MNATLLHVFAVNGASELRHTHLTRARGLEPELPPLDRWLGVDWLDTDRIEVFPVGDLGAMSLSDYVAMAFDPAVPPSGEVRARIDALEGSVLLVPDDAMRGEPRPGPELTSLATVPLAQPDHSADLPKAEVGPMPRPEPAAGAPSPERRGGSTRVLALLVLVAAILVLLYVMLGA